jgi:hypothetical protein
LAKLSGSYGCPAAAGHSAHHSNSSKHKSESLWLRHSAYSVCEGKHVIVIVAVTATIKVFEPNKGTSSFTVEVIYDVGMRYTVGIPCATASVPSVP